MLILIARTLYALVDVFSFVLFAYCISTWFPVERGLIADIRNALGKIVDPVLAPVRKIIPPLGGMVDFSPIIALFVLQFAVRLIVGVIV